MFFNVEIRNDGGIQPATLGSALDSFNQADTEILRVWCGYGSDFFNHYPDDLVIRFVKELKQEINRLIRRHGKKKTLESLL